MIPNEPRITPELVAEHGLKPDEYERIVKLFGRVPSFTELGIFSAMWNEHCSYKSSKVHLRTLPTQAPWVIQGPGENAGVSNAEGNVLGLMPHPEHAVDPLTGSADGLKLFESVAVERAVAA